MSQINSSLLSDLLSTNKEKRSFESFLKGLSSAAIFDLAYRVTFIYIAGVSIVFGFILSFDMDVEAARIYLGIPGVLVGLVGLGASYLGLKQRTLAYILMSLFIYFPISVYYLPVYPLAPLTQMVIIFPVSVLMYLEFRSFAVLALIAMYSGSLYFFDLYLDYSYSNFVDAASVKDTLQVYGMTAVLVSIPFVLVGYLIMYSVQLINTLQRQNENLIQANNVLRDVSRRNSHHIRKHLANVMGLISLSSEALMEYEIVAKEMEEMDNAIRETDKTINESLELNKKVLF